MVFNKENNQHTRNLLGKLGRSSALKIVNNSEGVSLRRILLYSEPVSDNNNLVVAIISKKLKNMLEEIVDPLIAIPGDSFQLVTADYSGIVIVDREAFYEGPWLGCDSHTGWQLNEEIFALCDLARTNGIPLYFVDSPRPESGIAARLRSVADCTFPFVDVDEELEEGAPLTELFSVLDRLARKRFA